MLYTDWIKKEIMEYLELSMMMVVTELKFPIIEKMMMVNELEFLEIETMIME